MKNYIIIFVLLSLSAITYLLFPITSKEHFVSIKDNKFSLNDKEFYPVAINYIASFQSDRNNLWVAPIRDYGYRFTTKDSALMYLKAEMDLIKEMGFNTVRIVGIEAVANEDHTDAVSIKISVGQAKDSSIVLSNKEIYNKYFNALRELFKIADEAQLKIIFLTSTSPKYKISEDYLRKLVTCFNKDATILAYDFFNEPLYFDMPERSKEDVYKIVKNWKRIMKTYAPNQLCTIGLEGIREVFEWDPNILDLDFVSLHPYEYEPEQVRNEIYWYGKYIKKPWIIGETAIPADNDSVSYETQKLFANKTIEQTYNCGGIGYSWWQFKDVDWIAFHASFMGVLNKKGETKTIKKNIAVKGTAKPVAEEFKKFNPTIQKGECLCLSNYYNYSQHKDCRIKGRLINENNEPIVGGVILAWNEYWSHSFHSITKEDGTFEVLGNFQFYHWMMSATSYSMVRGDILPDSAKTYSDKIPTMNIGKIQLKKLSL